MDCDERIGLMSHIYNFFAAISRMKYIDRWALMRNSRQENLSEHATEVAMIAHALCVIGNVRFDKDLDECRAALIGIYHDATEIITGDMPTPIKYYSESIRKAYKEVEHVAADRLLEKLPQDLTEEYKKIFYGTDEENEIYMRKLVKAADKLSALIKCIEEEKSGNAEFSMAKKSIQKAIDTMGEELPEVAVFCAEFLPSYGKTLDEL